VILRHRPLLTWPGKFTDPRIAGRGEQYTGWKQLSSGVALSEHQMTVEEAASFLRQQAFSSGTPVERILADKMIVASMYRKAARRLHPDVGGDPEMFKRLVKAKEIVETRGASR
jgi:hypothetical protein